MLFSTFCRLKELLFAGASHIDRSLDDLTVKGRQSSQVARDERAELRSADVCARQCDSLYLIRFFIFQFLGEREADDCRFVDSPGGKVLLHLGKISPCLNGFYVKVDECLRRLTHRASPCFGWERNLCLSGVGNNPENGPTIIPKYLE